MLTTLRIKNLALVADLSLDLQPGYNVITGETGAGKSVILGALKLVLGERADRTLIRSGAEGCVVETVFDVTRLRASLPAFLTENGLEACEEGQLVLKRAFNAAGANRQFVNGSPTTLAVLARLGDWLVDIHGPHDHQSLFHPARQLEILDAFGDLGSLRSEFAEILRRRGALEAEKTALIVDERTYAQQVDLLRFQAHEIRSARLQADEETPLLQEHQRAGNAAKLTDLCQTAQSLLGESEDSLLTRLGALGRLLQDWQRMDAGAAPLTELHTQAASLLQELQGELAHYAERIELDPTRLAELEERINLLQSLKRKYGQSLGDVIAFGEEAARKLQSLEQRDAELARLNAALTEASAELWRLGQRLSAARRQLIPKLAKAVRQELSTLGFRQGHFDVALSTVAEIGQMAGVLSTSGLDTVEFQFAPNPGEPARPLRAIASSGEIARVMLALKTVLAAEDDVPVLVFDEVDANVGGETAHAVGEKMRQIAERHQVLCITHLAPVAASASAHYVVSKQVKAGRTVAAIERLEAPGRVTELARMLGGGGEAARLHAEAMLKAEASRKGSEFPPPKSRSLNP